MSSEPAVLQVVILRDGLLVGTEVFVPGTYTLGSSAAADLKLEDPSVNPQHGVLYFQKNKVAIKDSSSSGGIFVNGHKVSTCEVRPVDEIACGPFILKTRVLEKKSSSKISSDIAALLKEGAAPIAPPPLRVGSGGPPVQAPAPVPPARVGAFQAKNSVPLRPAPAQGIGTVVSTRRATPLPEGAVQPASKKNGIYSRQRADPPEAYVGEETEIASNQFLNEIPGASAAGRSQRSRRSIKTGAPGTINVPAIRPDAKSAPLLYLELYWGNVRREARCFRRKNEPVIAAASDAAPMPLWGFSLKSDFVLAESTSKGFRLYVPPSSAVEKKEGNRFETVNMTDLEMSGSRRYLRLTRGSAVRMTEGKMTLVAYIAPKPERVWVNPLRGVPWLLLFLLAILGVPTGYFILFGPKPSETADFTQRSLPPVALRLIAPPPKKKEETKKKLERLKEETKKNEEVKEAKREKKVAVHEKPVHEKKKVEPKAEVAAPPPENKAIKALAKLSAAGPATKDILAAVDKLGNGPGSRHAKDNYKLSGLIGKAPIANAGLGTFGLGGGGRGGVGMLGAEILRGKGGGGIGAMGAGGVGRGVVGGTVARASARSVSVQGSIDREAVAKVVNAHLQEVRGCYERALLREPSLAGKVVLEWTISLGGKVSTAKTKSSTLRSSAVEACILESLKLWQFPPAKGGIVIVSYPFLFNSVGY